MCLSTTICLLMATIGGALLLPPCVGPASITAVALSAVAMRANAEHGFASVAASRSKQDFWHPDDDKPPLRSGDDADGSLLNRRVIKKLHFLMRGDTKCVRRKRWGGKQCVGAVAAALSARVREPGYPARMLVRRVKSQGGFRWKKHEVFLSEVLWGEPVGLLPLDERWFTIYFAQLPIALFDSRELLVVPWRPPRDFAREEAGEEEGPLDCTPSPRNCPASETFVWPQTERPSLPAGAPLCCESFGNFVLSRAS